MLNGRHILATLIPHAGDMCLIETVSEWDDYHIRCHSQTHFDPANPLRRAGRLSSIHGIEYAAQAAALHGALITKREGSVLAEGRLVAVRHITLDVTYLDDISIPLDIEAERMIAAGSSFIYQFRICADEQPLISGRLSVIADHGITGILQ